MKYKVTIEEVTEYDETRNVYEAEDDKRYFSTYNMPADLKYTTKVEKTGAKINKTRDVYVQDFEADDLVSIIKAVNEIM